MAAASLWQLDAVSLAPARLQEVSLLIQRGVTAVLGWSGAGKTSLLNLLAGFEEATAGRLQGSPKVAWVPQDGGLWGHCTAEEHLEIAGAAGSAGASLLADFDLRERAGALPHELSEGEQSRLAVARALASSAEVLIMDEPLVHVDPARVGRYWRLIREHLARSGASLVLATHVPETALAEASHAICLRQGRVLYAGLVTELYANPPTPELMTFLGPGNWLEPMEARKWLGVNCGKGACWRPERIGINAADDGPFRVQSASFMGSVAEAHLSGGSSMEEARLFYHRPPGASLAPGAPVRLRLLE